MFSLFNLSSIFQGGQLTPFAPMCGRHASIACFVNSYTATCPDDWHQYQGSCFYVSSDKETHSDSRSECQDMDADLASISNQAEMDFVGGIA